MGTFDIGAFELCVEGFGNVQHPCPIVVGAETPDQVPVQLTMAAQPPNGGTITPAPGTSEVLQESVVVVTATPTPGFRFLSWSPDVATPDDPSTTIFMDSSHTATAVFAACACASDVSQSVHITRGSIAVNAKKGVYEQIVTVVNTSAKAITGPLSLVLDNLTPGVTLTRASGRTSLMLPADSPYIDGAKSLAPGRSLSFKLQFINPDGTDFDYDARVLAGPQSR